jgi:Flp pilus assembly pilin Flp
MKHEDNACREVWAAAQVIFASAQVGTGADLREVSSPCFIECAGLMLRRRGCAAMSHVLAWLYVQLQELSRAEQGQDLIEYALAAACIFLAIAFTFPPLAATINLWFSALLKGFN